MVVITRQYGRTTSKLLATVLISIILRGSLVPRHGFVLKEHIWDVTSVLTRDGVGWLYEGFQSMKKKGIYSQPVQVNLCMVVIGLKQEYSPAKFIPQHLFFTVQSQPRFCSVSFWFEGKLSNFFQALYSMKYYGDIKNFVYGILSGRLYLDHRSC